MKLFRQLLYFSMMLYFLGIVTGSIASLLTNYKLKTYLIIEADEEASNPVNTQNLIEEDVICHEHSFAPDVSDFAHFSSHLSFYKTPAMLDVALSMVAPPPERA